MKDREDHDKLSDRELDALIAERVMGWAVVHVTKIDGGLDEWWSQQNYPLFAIHPGGGQWLTESLDDINSKAFQPSIEIADAMLVVEKMRQSGKWCCIEIYSDHHYIWRVSFTRSEPQNATHEVTAAANNESLPRAICEAALAALLERVE